RNDLEVVLHPVVHLLQEHLPLLEALAERCSLGRELRNVLPTPCHVARDGVDGPVALRSGSPLQPSVTAGLAAIAAPEGARAFARLEPCPLTPRLHEVVSVHEVEEGLCPELLERVAEELRERRVELFEMCGRARDAHHIDGEVEESTALAQKLGHPLLSHQLL